MDRDQLLISRARQLRRDMTDAERKLWYQLRGRRMAGHRFRRQAPIGSYIVDFACLASRLVIEVDGGQHAEEADEAYDARRTEWMETRGYRVLRFWDSDVLTDTDSVTEAIFNALAVPTPPTPALPLTGEGGP
jgi:very-short-patch-repair endonuclease